jgi:hypothetical protein
MNTEMKPHSAKLNLMNGDAVATRHTLSPARQKLADLQDQIAARERRITEHRAAADRLNDIITNHKQVAAALAEFDTESAEAVAEWAKQSLKPSGTAPVVDSKKRLELLTDVAAAQENAAAATNAQRQFTDLIHAEAQAVKVLESGIAQVIAEIIAEVASGPLLVDLQEAQRAVATKKSRLEQALQTVIGIAHSGPPEVMRPTFVLMEGLAETFRTTAPPAVDTGFADRAAWESFAARLRADSGAELEGQHAKL